MVNNIYTEKVVTEKIDIEITDIFQQVNVRSSENPFNNKKAVVEIVRNLNEDTFNIEYEKLHLNLGTDQISFIPYANAKGKDYISRWTHDYTDLPFSKTGVFPLHRSQIDEIKISKIDQLTVGYDLESNLLQSSKKDRNVTRHILSINIPEKNPIVNLKFNEILHLKSIKTIKVKPKLLPYKFGNYYPSNLLTRENVIENQGTEIEYTYNHLFLVPTKLNQNDSNEVIFDVFERNDNDRQIMFDQSFKGGEYDSNVFSPGKLTHIFVGNKNTKKEYVDNEGNKAKYVGSFHLIESSYYDYESKKSKKGLGPNYENGEIIPYSFKGLYSRNVSLGLNSAFPKLLIRMNKQIEKTYSWPIWRLCKTFNWRTK